MVKLFVFLGGLASCMLAELGYCKSFGKNPTVAMQKKFLKLIFTKISPVIVREQRIVWRTILRMVRQRG